MLFCIILAFAPHTKCIMGKELSFDKVNLCKSNVIQIFSNFFAIDKNNCLPTYLKSNANSTLKSPSNLSTGS